MEEPILKYERVQWNNGSGKGGSISALTIHDDYVALGTSKGWILLIDFYGNPWYEGSSTGILHQNVHTSAVNALSTDVAGTHIASAASDGSVVVAQVQRKTMDSDSDLEVHKVSCPLNAIALDPWYGIHKDCLYVTGGMAGTLVLNRKGWFTQTERVLHEGEGPVLNVEWRDDLLAWASWHGGIKVMDMVKGVRLAYIERPQGASRALCHLFWEAKGLLLAAWGEMVTILRIGNYGGETVSVFQCGFAVCSVTPFDETSLALIGLPFPSVQSGGERGAEEKQREEQGTGAHPEILIMDRRSGDVFSVDVLPMLAPWHHFDYFENDVASLGDQFSGGVLVRSTWQSRSIHRSRLQFPSSPPAIFLVVADIVVVARVRGTDDRVDWAFEKGDSLGALRCAMEGRNTLRHYTVSELVNRYLQELLSSSPPQTDKAAAACVELLGEDTIAWEHWVFEFGRQGALDALVPYVPTGNPQLPSAVYEVALEHLMLHRPEMCLTALCSWAPLCSIATLLARVEATLTVVPKEKRPLLLEAQAHLLVMDGQYERASRVYLAAGPGISRPAAAFSLIEKENLVKTLSGDVVRLIELDRGEAGRLLIRYVNTLLPIANVVRQLQEAGRKDMLYWYLHIIFSEVPEVYNIQEYASYHILQVSLYAERAEPFQPGRDIHDSELLRFLRGSNFVPLEVALAACERRDPPLYDEMVYALGELGMTQQALSILLVHVRSVRRAIEFVEAHDNDLWVRLFDAALHNEYFLAGLLDVAGAYDIDVNQLIARIPEGTQVPGLRDKLAKILADESFTVALHETALLCLLADTSFQAKALQRMGKRGVRGWGRSGGKVQIVYPPVKQQARRSRVGGREPD